jgi:YMGG-like Gly-zipper
MALLVMGGPSRPGEFGNGVPAMHASLRPRRGDFGSSRTPVLVPALAALLALGGCTMTETEQRAVSGTGIGAAVGAAGGALIGAIAGKPGTGAAIGAATGAAVGGTGGYIRDQQVKRGDAQAEADQLRAENEQLRLQQEAERLRLENQRLQQELQQHRQN